MGIRTNYKTNLLPVLVLAVFTATISISSYSLYKLSPEYICSKILHHSVPGFACLDKNNIKNIASATLIHNDYKKRVGFEPLDYMKYCFFGFLELKDIDSIVKASKTKSDLKNIKNYSDVPEGEIFFSEEDEYIAKEWDEQKDNVNISAEVGIAKEEFSQNIKIPNKIVLLKKNPEILIYHSHATESYTPYTDGNYHTLNEKYNVISVGSIMAKNLEKKYNYKVVHDKTYHDKDSYAYSYTNSLATIKQQTAKNKSLKVFLDIHRDAFTVLNNEHKKTKKSEYTSMINGKSAARIMLVISSANDNYGELEKFAAYIKRKMDKLYPGLYLKTDKKTRSKYNLYISNYAILIEVGCMLNTIDEANYSAELMSNVIGEVLKDLQE